MAVIDAPVDISVLTIPWLRMYGASSIEGEFTTRQIYKTNFLSSFHEDQLAGRPELLEYMFGHVSVLSQVVAKARSTL